MNAAAGAKPPVWFWVVSALLFAWMCIGVIGFAMTDAEAIAKLPEAQQQLYALMPKWLWVVYGIATISGLIGAFLLLLRKAWSVPALVLSLVAVCLQMGYSLLVMPTIELAGASAAAFPLVIIALGGVAVWLSMSAKRRGWLS